MQAVPGEQPSQFDGEDDDHNLIQGEWRQNANMHEIRNVDALARTARMGSSSVNSTRLNIVKNQKTKDNDTYM